MILPRKFVESSPRPGMTLECLEKEFGEVLLVRNIARGGRFVFQKSRPNETEITLKEFLNDHSEAYLYGEPIPESMFPGTPDMITSPVTSKLLWVTPSSSLSPLHYDLSEGILTQIHGTKTVLLLPPTREVYDAVDPFPQRHPSDRQSQLSVAMDGSGLPEPIKEQAMVFTINQGESLYIPYGWWHQVQAAGSSISVTWRWNPYLESLQTALLLSKQVFTETNMPPEIFRDLLLDMGTDLPDSVLLYLRLRLH